MDGWSSETDAGIARDLLIVNQRGLHARASAKFVQLADSFRAAIIAAIEELIATRFGEEV